MKVLHLTGDREDMGGILSVIRNIQTVSAAWEHSVWVNRQYLEVRRPTLNYRFSRHVCAYHQNHFVLLARSFCSFFELKNLLKREHFDVINAHTRGTFFVALGIARFLKRPVIFTNHSFAKRIHMYRNAAANENIYTVVLTPNMLRYYRLAEAFPKVSIISDCCADAFFAEPLPEPRQTVQGATVRLAGVGNIMRWKNWHLLMRALLELKPAERARLDFSLWGPRPSDADSIRYDNELRALVSTSGLSAQFHFRGMTHAITECLREADWFILPSTNEPCSVALIEALALGRPAVASASGGNVDIICPMKTGLLFEPDNAAHLAEKLRLLLNGNCSPSLPSEIRNSVRHRSASSVAVQYTALYQSLAAGGRDAAKS